MMTRSRTARQAIAAGSRGVSGYSVLILVNIVRIFRHFQAPFVTNASGCLSYAIDQQAEVSCT